MTPHLNPLAKYELRFEASNGRYHTVSGPTLKQNKFFVLMVISEERGRMFGQACEAKRSNEERSKITSLLG